MNKTLNAAAWPLGLALLFFLHFYKLGAVPGLHYDEAWALNYSWRIAFEEGFWPLQAMSPYTAPWAHYWGALWFKLFGPSMLVFRSSQIVLALSGLLFLGLSLKQNFRLRFLWALLLIPALVLNHRFAVELNGLHALALGCLALSLKRKSYAGAAFFAILGTTAHILFYAVSLGLLTAVFLQNMAIDRRARSAAIAYFALTGLFFLRVLLEIPEKGKAAALVASSLMAIALLFLQGERWKVCRWAWWERGVMLGAAVFVFNGLFFAQGWWSLSIQSGINAWNGLPGILCGSVFVLLFAFLTWEHARRIKKWMLLWMAAGTFFLGVMMLKPAPRYFEVFFLGLAFLWAGELRSRLMIGAACALVVNAVLVLWPYTAPFPVVESDRRFLFFKDSNRDFLESQNLVKFLGSSGCALSDIHTGDPRLFETFKALARGDWAVNASQPCPWNYVSRASEANGIGDPFGEFRLRRKQ